MVIFLHSISSAFGTANIYRETTQSVKFSGTKIHQKIQFEPKAVDFVCIRFFMLLAIQLIVSNCHLFRVIDHWYLNWLIYLVLEFGIKLFFFPSSLFFFHLCFFTDTNELQWDMAQIKSGRRCRYTNSCFDTSSRYVDRLLFVVSYQNMPTIFHVVIGSVLDCALFSEYHERKILITHCINNNLKIHYSSLCSFKSEKTKNKKSHCQFFFFFLI